MAGEVLLVEARVDGPRPEAPRLHARFEVPPGITVLTGPSGAGKSTCLAAIAGLLKLDGGRIALGEEVLSAASPRLHVPSRRRRVALVFQSLALFPHLSAEENVAYGLSRTLTRAQRRTEALRWLQRTRVAHLLGRRPSTFSGGESQRVALARALASSPRVLLLDEPFSAIEATLRRALGEDLQALVAEARLPTVFVTHDLLEAQALGERVVHLEAGRVVPPSAPFLSLAPAGALSSTPPS